MMVNSNVPRYSNLASELHRNYLFKFTFVLSSVRSNTHMIAAPLCEQIMRRSIRNFNIPPPGIPRAFDCASCPERGEFERCVWRVGNLNRIYLLFWLNTPVSFFRFSQGLTDLQYRISPLLVNNSFKRVFKRRSKVSLRHISLKSM